MCCARTRLWAHHAHIITTYTCVLNRLVNRFFCCSTFPHHGADLPMFTSACGTSVRSRLAGFGAMWILQPFSIGCPLTNVCLHNVFAIVSQRDGGVVGGPTSSGGDGGAAGSEGAWEEAKVSYCAILAVSANRLQCHQKGI